MSPSNAGGQKPTPPEELRNPILREHGARIAAECFRWIYETWPELADRYGEHGRTHTAQDNFWHLTYLDSASFLGDRQVFDRYAEWLTRFLVSRGMEPRHISETFRFIARQLARIEAPPDQAPQRDWMVETLDQAASRVDLSIGAGRPPADPAGGPSA